MREAPDMIATTYNLDRRWQTESNTPSSVAWLTWPILFAINLGTAMHAIARHWDYSTTLAALLAINVLVLVALESLFPVKRIWSMSWRSFGRDLKYLFAGNATFAAVNVTFGLASIRLIEGHVGPLTDWPLYAAFPATLLVVD